MNPLPSKPERVQTTTSSPRNGVNGWMSGGVGGWASPRPLVQRNVLTTSPPSIIRYPINPCSPGVSPVVIEVNAAAGGGRGHGDDRPAREPGQCGHQRPAAVELLPPETVHDQQDHRPAGPAQPRRALIGGQQRRYEDAHATGGVVRQDGIGGRVQGSQTVHPTMTA